VFLVCWVMPHVIERGYGMAERGVSRSAALSLGTLALTQSQVQAFIDVAILLDTTVDFLRFVTEFFEVIDQSVPHLYHAVLLSPLSSVVRKLYGHFLDSPMSKAVIDIPASSLAVVPGLGCLSLSNHLPFHLMDACWPAPIIGERAHNIGFSSYSYPYLEPASDADNPFVFGIPTEVLSSMIFPSGTLARSRSLGTKAQSLLSPNPASTHSIYPPGGGYWRGNSYHHPTLSWALTGCTRNPYCSPQVPKLMENL
jgi:hypothetical protein